MAVRIRDVKIPVGEIFLEAKLGCDEKISTGPGVLICHPHPQFGGSMDNNVVWALFDAFVERGYVAVAFNFRGVGSQRGATRGWRGRNPGRAGRVGLAGGDCPKRRDSALASSGILSAHGWGFEQRYGMIGCAAWGRSRHPLAMYSFSFLKDLSVPLYVVSGGQDAFCPVDGKEALCSELSNEVNWKILEGSGSLFLELREGGCRVSGGWIRAASIALMGASVVLPSSR